MKRTAWTIFLLTTTAIETWPILPAMLGRDLGIRVLIGYCVIATLGSLWMLYRCLHRERRPFPLALLAFIPYAFLWYYFEKVRQPQDGRPA